MPGNDWGALTPEVVAGWINFDHESPDWAYRAGEDSMPARQAEGVAGLWNKLALYRAALLADEVGMGKTFQALGIMALLWKLKPDARVLVMAPNRDICRHWAREYSAFVRDHYRQVDHRVRNAADGGPVHEPQMCWRLGDLATLVEAGAGNFFITTIYSLSGLVRGEDEDGFDRVAGAERAARDIHVRLKQALGEDGFDLVVVDEAHYFRNDQGGSQRAHAARQFFGVAGDRLGMRALLMTATPSHSSMDNIASILGYVTDLGAGEAASPVRLLDRYAIRRLRRMKGRDGSHDKYSYRNEVPVEAVFEGDPAAEIFFALYQRRLVMDQAREGRNKRYLYGYLEGFESFETGMTDGDDERKRGDFKGARDTQILRQLAQMHARLGRLPAHPKYDALVRHCVPDRLFDAAVDLHELKHLVFVRRIPSVREIAKRINAAYDRLLGRRILRALAPDEEVAPLSAEWERQNWSREYFNALVSRLASAADDEDLASSALSDDEEPSRLPEPDADDSMQSRIAHLFVVKKDGQDRSTDASNVSRRFRAPESVWSLLLEPASDYRNGPYLYYFRKSSGARVRDDYGAAALARRLALHDDLTRRTEAAPEGSQSYAAAMPTLWGMMYDLLPPLEQVRLTRWVQRDAGIAENFGNYLKSGFAFASPVMVELYCWDVEFRREQHGGDAQQRYLDFVDFIRPRLPASLAFAYFRAALETFEALCEKITDHGLADWRQDWGVLTGLQSPALYASGDVSDRQRLILGFNSPFYPHVLAATAVFQEGVNLHLQCRKVHHYGIAWTPGDNEQRVGRVDRLFGKVNAQLARHGSAELAIHYPYLAASFDEEQLASFIQLKHGVEERMDACRHSQVSSEIDLRNATENWRQFLRKPRSISAADRLTDPFPYRPDEHPTRPYPVRAGEVPVDLGEHVRRLIAAAVDADTDLLLHLEPHDSHPGVIALVESEISLTAGRRKQPIVVELHYSSRLSALAAQTVYVLTLRSPLASRAALQDRGGGMIDPALMARSLHDCPLVRPVLEKGGEHSHFYLHVRADLPLFALESRHTLLAVAELRMALVQIRQAADRWERGLFNGQQDLRKEDLALSRHAQPVAAGGTVEEGSSEAMKSAWAQASALGGRVIYRQKVVAYTAAVALLEEIEGGKAAKSPLENLLRLNHYLPLVRFGLAECRVVATLAYPAGHLQAEEQGLLAKWLGYLTRRLDLAEDATRVHPDGGGEV